MANIPGATNVIPGVFSDVVTESRGVSLGSGLRVAAIIGEGSTVETLVSSAVGNGDDGLNPDYTSTTDPDGRHFRIASAPVVANRTRIFVDGVLQTGIEQVIDDEPFNTKYQYRFDPATGQIQMQEAHLVDQGGSIYSALSTNVGLGRLNSLNLQDISAPPEQWTIRCVSVQRDNSNQPIQNTARFIAIGSISGNKVDANGNPVVWVANNQVVSNGVLSFSIEENKVSGNSTSPFREGDAFIVIVESGVLNRGQSLTATYVPVANINDPVFIDNMDDVLRRHGSPSLENNLSLGAQLAFSNGAPGVMAVQAAPAMPRRQSIILSDAVNATSTDVDDFIFPLPTGVAPDADTNIHFFITNNATNVETQILPNKFAFYTLGTGGNPSVSTFINDNTPAPGGNSYFYSVISQAATIDSGFDGYLARDPSSYDRGIFTGSNKFTADFVGKTLKIIDATNVANNGDYLITAVTNGNAFFTVSSFPDFTTETVAFEVIDPTTGSEVDGYAATDGALTAVLGTGTATLTSVLINFAGISNITNYRLRINASDDNNGLYDITAYNSGTDTLTIRKAIVQETNLRYEVVDASDNSNYVVINKNVVPNGYGLRVTFIDEKDSTFYDAGWIRALESLEAVECDIVVPLPKQTISVIFQNTLNHCRVMSNIRNKKERVLFCGGISGLTPDNVTGVRPAAVEDIGILEGIQGDSITEVLAGNVEDLANYSVPSAFGNTYRCVYFYPDQIVVNAGGQNTLVDGFYLAAAAAGYLAGSTRIEEPLTNKVLSGFTILRNKLFRPRVLESLTSAGVCVLQPVVGGGRVIWGLTTSQSGYAEEQEISIVFIRDAVAKRMRNAFTGFIGTAETPTLIPTLQATALNVLNSLVGQNLITKYADLKVERDRVDPRQWNISVRVQPNYPVNFIYIRVSVGLL